MVTRKRAFPSKVSLARTILLVLVWEFVQNLPLVSGFIVAIQLWRRNDLAMAIMVIVASSIVGSLLIGALEPKIIAGHREPKRLILVNAVSMSLLMLGGTVYVSAGWSDWKTDLGGGMAAGVLLSIIQGVVTDKRIRVHHSVAFGISIPLVFVVTRVIISALPWTFAVVITTAVMTLVIVLFDYIL